MLKIIRVAVRPRDALVGEQKVGVTLYYRRLVVLLKFCEPNENVLYAACEVIHLKGFCR